MSRKVSVELPEWLYNYFLDMYHLDTGLSKNPCKTLEEYIKNSVISIVLEIDPEAKERLDVKDNMETQNWTVK